MKKVLSDTELKQKLTILSNELNHKCEKIGGGITFICVLNGGFMFFSDLVKLIKYPIKIDFIQCKSYNNNKQGVLKITKEIEEFRTDLNIPKDKTFIMPAGDTRETLVKMYPLVFEMVAEHGYNMTGRDHIIAYNTERGV